MFFRLLEAWPWLLREISSSAGTKSGPGVVLPHGICWCCLLLTHWVAQGSGAWVSFADDVAPEGHELVLKPSHEDTLSFVFWPFKVRHIYLR